jgi:acyl-CoA synthetase (AMP-forming)/AMP-acid ligase II
MSEIMDGTTIGTIFTAAVSAHGDRPFLAVPANDARGYLPSGFEITYGEVGKCVDELAAVYRVAGYGLGHRVATLLENRPEYVIHKLALNSIGVCCVPINPDYRAGEITYLIEHSEQATARSSLIAFIRSGGGGRLPRRGQPLCIISE